MGFSRQEYWSGLPFPSPEDLPHPGIEPGSPTLLADALPSEPPGKSGRAVGKKLNPFWKKKTSSRDSTFFPKYFHVVIHIQCVVFSKRNYYACNRTNRRKPAVETGYTDYSKVM